MINTYEELQNRIKTNARALIKYHDLTIPTVAKRLGYCQANLYHYLSPIGRKFDSLELLYGLSKVLKVTPRDLMEKDFSGLIKKANKDLSGFKKRTLKDILKE